jgi:hypothetical protein
LRQQAEQRLQSFPLFALYLHIFHLSAIERDIMLHRYENSGSSIGFLLFGCTSHNVSTGEFDREEYNHPFHRISNIPNRRVQFHGKLFFVVLRTFHALEQWIR